MAQGQEIVDKQHSILLHHLHDLAESSLAKGKAVYTDFLAYDELAVFYDHRREFSYVEHHSSGRDELSERRMLCFGQPYTFPIRILKVERRDADVLTHRDYLGALMHLGVERSLIGNIYVIENEAFIEVVERIAPLIMHELQKVRHSVVKVTASALPEGLLLHTEQKQISAASERLDAVIASLYNLSREKAQQLIEAEKVILAHRKPAVSLTLKAGEVVSVRGYGKFRYGGMVRQTKKERLILLIEQYHSSSKG